MELKDYLDSWRVADKDIIERFNKGITSNLIHNLTTMCVSDETLFNYVIDVLSKHDKQKAEIIIHEVMCNLAGV